MIRNLKALGLALVATLVLSALGTSAARATQVYFTAEKYPADLHAGPTNSHLFTAEGGRQITCDTATLTGTLWEWSNELTIGANYSGCHAKILGVFFPVTYTKGGCFFKFTVVTSTTEGTVDIACPTGGGMEFHVYEPGKPHLDVYEVCRYTVLSQENLSEVDFQQVGSELEITATLGSVTYTRLKGLTVTCGPENGKGSFIGSSLFAAEDEENKKVKVDIGK